MSGKRSSALGHDCQRFRHAIGIAQQLRISDHELDAFALAFRFQVGKQVACAMQVAAQRHDLRAVDLCLKVGRTGIDLRQPFQRCRIVFAVFGDLREDQQRLYRIAAFIGIFFQFRHIGGQVFLRGCTVIDLRGEDAHRIQDSRVVRFFLKQDVELLARLIVLFVVDQDLCIGNANVTRFWIGIEKGGEGLQCIRAIVHRLRHHQCGNFQIGFDLQRLLCLDARTGQFLVGEGTMRERDVAFNQIRIRCDQFFHQGEGSLLVLCAGEQALYLQDQQAARLGTHFAQAFDENRFGFRQIVAKHDEAQIKLVGFVGSRREFAPQSDGRQGFAGALDAQGDLGSAARQPWIACFLCGNQHRDICSCQSPRW